MNKGKTGFLFAFFMFIRTFAPDVDGKDHGEAAHSRRVGEVRRVVLLQRHRAGRQSP